MRSAIRKIYLRRIALILFAIAGVIQLGWLSQYAAVCPRAAEVTEARESHSLCRCAPTRIAAGTCCCARANPAPCCDKPQQTAGKNKSAGKVTICPLPCGDEDPLLVTGLDDLLQTSLLTCCIPVRLQSPPLSPPRRGCDQRLPPPVPPPEV